MITGLTMGAADVLVHYRRMAEWAPGAEGYPLGALPPTPAVPDAPQAPLPAPRAKKRK